MTYPCTDLVGLALVPEAQADDREAVLYAVKEALRHIITEANLRQARILGDVEVSAQWHTLGRAEQTGQEIRALAIRILVKTTPVQLPPPPGGDDSHGPDPQGQPQGQPPR